MCICVYLLDYWLEGSFGYQLDCSGTNRYHYQLCCICVVIKMHSGGLAIPFTVLFVLLVLLAKAQDDCSDYTVKVEQNDFIDGLDMTLTCSYTSSTEDLVKWETKPTANETYRDAYIGYPTFPDISHPAPEFSNKLVGHFESSSHSITIYNSSVDDDLKFWICIVFTPDCVFGVGDEVELMFTSKLTKLLNVCMV